MHISPKRTTCPAYHTLLDLITRIIVSDAYKSWNISCNFRQFPFTCILLVTKLCSGPVGNTCTTSFSFEVNLSYVYKLCVCVHVICIFLFILSQQPNLDLGHLIVEVSVSSQLDTHSVGLPWTSDQHVAEAATYATHTQTRETHVFGGIRTRMP